MVRTLLLPITTLLLGLFMSAGPTEYEDGPTAYPEHLTGAFTGGFGEETCRSCHFDYDLNPDGGSLSISGAGKSITKGEVAVLEIAVEREELGRAGFQLSARFEDGSQAGSFEIEDNERLIETNSVPDSLQYIQHSKSGSEPAGAGKNNWTVRWRTPEAGSGIVFLNVAANAANGDQSEFGDYIFAKEVKLDF